MIRIMRNEFQKIDLFAENHDFELI